MKKMTKVFGAFLPPRRWIIPVAFVLGILIGLLIIILRISNATAYLSDDPKACINCHVMFPEYETWFHSSHRQYAVCNDCHVPHDSIVNKYLFKAKDGMRHATIYTLRTEPQVIRMHEPGQEVVQSNCIRCHSNLLDETDLIHAQYKDYLQGNVKLCWDCHRDVSHGRTKSLAATAYYHVPQLSDPTPESMKFLRSFLEKLIFSEENKNE